MSIQIHKRLLERLGIELSDDDAATLFKHMDSALNERVIDEIIDRLSDRQLQELGDLEGATDAALDEWLTTNVPDLKRIIEDEIAILLGEIVEEADHL